MFDPSMINLSLLPEFAKDPSAVTSLMPKGGLTPTALSSTAGRTMGGTGFNTGALSLTPKQLDTVGGMHPADWSKIKDLAPMLFGGQEGTTKAPTGLPQIQSPNAPPDLSGVGRLNRGRSMSLANIEKPSDSLSSLNMDTGGWGGNIPSAETPAAPNIGGPATATPEQPQGWKQNLTSALQNPKIQEMMFSAAASLAPNSFGGRMGANMVNLMEQWKQDEWKAQDTQYKNMVLGEKLRKMQLGEQSIPEDIQKKHPFLEGRTMDEMKMFPGEMYRGESSQWGKPSPGTNYTEESKALYKQTGDPSVLVKAEDEFKNMTSEQLHWMRDFNPDPVKQRMADQIIREQEQEKKDAEKVSLQDTWIYNAEGTMRWPAAFNPQSGKKEPLTGKGAFWSKVPQVVADELNNADTWDPRAKYKKGQKEHVLSGRKAGRYKVNGKEIQWNGEKEIE